MPDVRITDERIRSFLDGNQPARERMCLALLGIDQRFTELRPRRPMGGPDGGRDIEGEWQGKLFYGGVGFRNCANDSNEDKRWVIKKFKADLLSAKEANPLLTQFVFFTNVDLTNGDREEFEKHAFKFGFENVEIFYRERIRLLLDGNPAGYVIRLQYLSIPMSEEEQLSFFSRFGAEIEQLITSNFERVERRFARVEFLAESQKQLNCLYCIVSFTREFTPEELGCFFFQLEIVDIRKRQGVTHPGISLGVRESYDAKYIQDGVETPLFGFRNIAWINPEGNKIVDLLRIGPVINFRQESTMDPPVFQMTEVRTTSNRAEVLAKIYDQGPLPTISSLENCFFFIRTSLDSRRDISAITLIADEYIIFQLPSHTFDIVENPNIHEVPTELREGNSYDKYWTLTHPGLARLSFSEYTPRKYTGK